MEISKYDVVNKELILNPKYVSRVATQCYFRKNDLTFDIEKLTFKTGKIKLELEIILETITHREDVLSATFTTSADFTTTSAKAHDAIYWEHFLYEFYLASERFLEDVSNVPGQMILPIGILLNSYQIGILAKDILSELTALDFYV